MPNYLVTNLETSTENQRLKTGSFSRLLAKFQFTHKMTYVLMRDYLPSAFIVVTSWLSFYIDPAASPARVSLAVVTVLSIATQLTSTFNATPEVSYIKAIDWYVIGCFLFVFAAMIEYGFTHKYGGATERDEARNKEGTSNAGAVVPGAEDENVNRSITANSVADSTNQKSVREHHDKMAPYRNTYSCKYPSRFSVNQAHFSNHHHESNTMGQPSSSLHSLKLLFIDSYPKLSSADSVSRVLFPLLFLTFNAIYWCLVFLL